MNEFEKLAVQAGIYAKPRQVDESPIIDIGILTPHRKYVSDEKYIQDNFDVVRAVLEGYGLEKFAELIVKKCLSIMENCEGDVDYAIWKTKKDFGVKE